MDFASVRHLHTLCFLSPLSEAYKHTEMDLWTKEQTITLTPYASNTQGITFILPMIAMLIPLSKKSLILVIYEHLCITFEHFTRPFNLLHSLFCLLHILL